MEATANQPFDTDVVETTIMDLHKCYVCDKLFSSSSTMNRHIRNVHKCSTEQPGTIVCGLCSKYFLTHWMLDDHLGTEHGVYIETEHLAFASEEDFQNWKKNVEDSTRSKYFKQNRTSFRNDVEKSIYYCHRSGKSRCIKEEDRKRAIKYQGLNKMGYHCPARIASVKTTPNCIEVKFVKTHVGHTTEIGSSLSLPRKRKKKKKMPATAPDPTTTNHLVNQTKPRVRRQNQSATTITYTITDNRSEENQAIEHIIPVVEEDDGLQTEFDIMQYLHSVTLNNSNSQDIDVHRDNATQKVHALWDEVISGCQTEREIEQTLESFQLWFENRVSTREKLTPQLSSFAVSVVVKKICASPLMLILPNSGFVNLRQ